MQGRLAVVDRLRGDQCDVHAGSRSRARLKCDGSAPSGRSRHYGGTLPRHTVGRRPGDDRTRLREAGATAADVSVVPDPVDLDLIEATPPATAHEDDIVFAGRLDPDGNLESLLLALAELRAFDWSATVVGDGPLRSEHRRQARELRIDDRVRFVGDLDRRERVGVYRAARAFVQTARRRVFAEELLWALASGCVGVVEYHADSGAHELVERRDRGLRTTDETELVDALRSLSEYERRDRDADFDEYDRAAVAARLEECYRAAGAEG